MRSSPSGSWRWAGEDGNRAPDIARRSGGRAPNRARRGESAVTHPESAPPHAHVDGEAGDVVIRIRGLVNQFGEQTVHDGLDLDVRRGEIIGVVGGSGTGKSVMMRSILGLRKPNAGE